MGDDLIREGDKIMSFQQCLANVQGRKGPVHQCSRMAITPNGFCRQHSTRSRLATPEAAARLAKWSTSVEEENAERRMLQSMRESFKRSYVRHSQSVTMRPSERAMTLAGIQRDIDTLTRIIDKHYAPPELGQ